MAIKLGNGFEIRLRPDAPKRKKVKSRPKPPNVVS